MKLNLAERLLLNNPARAFVQRFYELPLLLRTGGAVQGASVLEVGCGRGIGVDLLLRELKAAHVTAIDIDPRQIARAYRRLARHDPAAFSLVLASADRLPFPANTFDAVFDFGILHHVPAWQHAVAEIRRVLKPGGTFFFEEVTRAALERWLYRTFLQHPTENRFSEAEFLQELQRHGLQPNAPPSHTLFGDIFLGVATATPKQ